MALDNGTIKEFYGKSLDDINVNVLVSDDDPEDPEPDVTTEDYEPTNDEELDNEPLSWTSSGTTSKKGIKRGLEEPKTTKKKKLVSTPTKHESIKASWSTPEKHTVRKIFKKYLSPTKKLLPTPLECRNAIRNHKDLKSRTINQLKGWVFSERQRIRRNLGLIKKN